MAQVTVDQAAHKDFRWNFSVNVLDIVFIVLGFSLISRDTVMPTLVSELTDSKLAIGLIPAIFTLGFYFPQLFSANFSEGLVYKKPFLMLLSSFGERLPYLLIGIVIWLFAVPMPALALGLFFLCLAVASFAAGYGTPAWYDMIAKVIPVRYRGIWSGMGHGVGALLGAAGALLIVGPVLAGFPYPTNFALLFVLAFFAMAASWVMLALNREPPSTEVKQNIPITRYFSQLPAVLRANANYRRYVISRGIVLFGTMAGSFYIIYGREELGVTMDEIGYLTLILTISTFAMNLIWGLMADRFGHKTILCIAGAILACTAASALLAPSERWLTLTFVLLGAYVAADTVSSLNIILEFCAPADRPTYIGLTNTLLAPLFAFAPIIGGLVATAFGFPALFGLAFVAAVIGTLMLTFWVREPRHAAVTEPA